MLHENIMREKNRRKESLRSASPSPLLKCGLERVNGTVWGENFISWNGNRENIREIFVINTY